MADQELWGGAARSAVPSGWTDVSTLREVPDHQEVFAEEGAPHRSLIFEIVEAAVAGDDDAGAYYLGDLFETAGAAASARVFSAGAVQPVAARENLPAGEADAEVRCVAAFGRMRVGKFRATAAEAPDDVDVAMLIFRLPHVGTDILVTLNLPRVVTTRDGATKDAAEGGAGDAKPAEPATLEDQEVSCLDGDPDGELQMLSKVLKTFHVQDWRLFG